MFNASGAISPNPPEGTNPERYGLPPRTDLLYPVVYGSDVKAGNLTNLYKTPMTAFRNSQYDLDFNTYDDLAAHSRFHLENKSFGTGDEALGKLFIHQELMFEGILAGMSFLESH